MDDPTQVPPPEPGHAVTGADPAPPGGPAEPPAAPPEPAWGGPPPTIVVDPGAERAERGLWIWFAIVSVAGLVGVALSEAQLGLFAAAGGVFAVAHAVERVPRWRLLHHFLVALVTLGGALVFTGLLRFTLTAPLAPLQRALGAGSSAVAIVACLALLSRRVADVLVRGMFRGAASTAVTRLAARIVAISFLLSLPLWIAFRAMLATGLLDGLDLGGNSAWGGLIGLGLLALGGVGAFVTRSPRAAAERLGLRPLALPDLGWVLGGVLGLAGLNSGIEWLQKTWFPAQYAFDQKVVGLMAGDLTRWDTLMLGLSAGFGEEIAMRGALQPRLGLVLTALLFAALHVQYSWTGMSTIVLFGLALGLVRQRSSTTTAILIHAIYDVIAASGAQGR